MCTICIKANILLFVMPIYWMVTCASMLYLDVYMLPTDGFLPLRLLLSSLLSQHGSVYAVLPSLGLFLSLGKFKWHYLSARMIGPIRFSVNKRRAEAQQKKQFLKGFPKSLILCFCHVTFSRFVCWEMHHVWMGTALTRATFFLVRNTHLTIKMVEYIHFLGIYKW